MANFTLDDIREAAEAKYGDTVITLGDGTEVKMVNPLQLPAERRKVLRGLQDDMDHLDDAETEEVDESEVVAKALRVTILDDAQADKLIAELDGNLAVMFQLFEQYNESVDLGEASPSAK